MALTSSILYSAFLSSRFAGIHPMLGANYQKWSQAVSLAVHQWGVSQPSNLALRGLASGVAGTGIIAPTGSRIIVPPDVYGVRLGFVKGHLEGPLSQSLATVLARGISQAFTVSAEYTGPSVGVGQGADVSSITVVNTKTLIATLMRTMSQILGSGSALTNMATGIGEGISALLSQGTATGYVTGTVTAPPAPASTTTTSTVV